MVTTISDKLKLGTTVGFELHANGVLVNDYDYVVIEGIIPANECSKYGHDVYSLHPEIFRQVPAGTMPDDPESYYYLLLKTSLDKKVIVGIPWINMDTVKVYNSITAVFTVPNISQEDINAIAGVIERYGYTATLTIK